MFARRFKSVCFIILASLLLQSDGIGKAYADQNLDGSIESYIEGNSLVQEPVVFHRGVTIIPQTWEAGDNTLFSDICIKFLIQNDSGQNIEVFSDLRGCVNEFVVGFSSAAYSLAPQEQRCLSLYIDPFSLRVNGIEKIRSMDVAFHITYESDQTTYGTGLVPVRTMNPLVSEAIPFQSDPVYSSDGIKVMNARELTEFPGAYGMRIVIHNTTTAPIKAYSQFVSINGEPLDTSTNLGADVELIPPGKMGTLLAVVSYKNESGNLPIQDITWLKWKVRLLVCQQNDDGKLSVLKEIETDEFQYYISK